MSQLITSDGLIGADQKTKNGRWAARSCLTNRLDDLQTRFGKHTHHIPHSQSSTLQAYHVPQLPMALIAAETPLRKSNSHIDRRRRKKNSQWELFSLDEMYWEITGCFLATCCELHESCRRVQHAADQPEQTVPLVLPLPTWFPPAMFKIRCNKTDSIKEFRIPPFINVSSCWVAALSRGSRVSLRHHGVICLSTCRCHCYHIRRAEPQAAVPPH